MSTQPQNDWSAGRPTQSLVSPTSEGTDESAVVEPAKPNHGWRKALYKINCMCGYPNKVPPISQKQKDEIAEDARQAAEAAEAERLRQEAEAEAQRLQQEAEAEIIRREELKVQSVTRLNELADERPTAIVVFINSKGNGAKTTSTVQTATRLCLDTGAEVTVFDGNWASGTAAQRLNKENGETITAYEAWEHLAELGQSHRAYIARVRANRHRVRSIAADPPRHGAPRLSAVQYKDLLGLGSDNCEYLFVDSVNDIGIEQCLAMIDMADVLVFTANVGEQDSLRQLGSSMQLLREHGFTDKVNRAVVQISNLPEGADLDDYRKYLNLVNMRNNVIMEFPGHIGPFVGIPHDPSIANAGIVAPEEQDDATVQAFRDDLIAILGQAPKIRPLTTADSARWQPQEGDSS